MATFADTPRSRGGGTTPTASGGPDQATTEPLRPQSSVTLLPPEPALRLHHVGVVVADLQAAIAGYSLLGFATAERLDLPEQRVIAALYRTGTGYLELIQPIDRDGPIARFLAKRGEGLHHVAYAVPDLPAALRRLAAADVRLIDDAPRAGVHGWRIAFVHPESCLGVLTELVEVPAGGAKPPAD